MAAMTIITTTTATTVSLPSAYPHIACQRMMKGSPRRVNVASAVELQSDRMSTSFPLDGMRVRFAGATNIGRKRDHNEDSISLPETERLAIVADGMGGHASGEVA